MAQPAAPQETNWKQLRRLAAIVLVCAFLGEYLLEDVGLMPDPKNRRSISFGLGGMFGLLLGFVIHLWTRKSRRTP